MINGTFILFAVLLGYAVAVGLSMLATFSITKAAPAFVVKDHLLKPSYRFVQDLAWLVCVSIGAYAAAWIADLTLHPSLVAITLIATLLIILWTNTWEMAQRGLGHQVAMSLTTVIGVGIGFAIHLH